jgi:hypothetical protein
LKHLPSRWLLNKFGFKFRVTDRLDYFFIWVLESMIDLGGAELFLGA